MSGILGLFHLAGGDITRRDLSTMASFLERRGPEGTHLWAHGPVGLGHTRLSTTPEALEELLPLVHQPSGCAITADLRLDNRAELLSALGLRATDPDTGDAGLVLHAYLRWGSRCVERLLGDFAFAIWDPRRHQFFCARDHLGMKPFNYHHGPGKVFAFASSPVAVVAHEGVPYTVNMARVADALLPELEGVDTTSTFFEGVHRLPPAHAMLVSPEGLTQWRYWTLNPEVEFYASDAESIEAFLDAFTKAVDARLRTVGPRASMLSGGMDSNSVVAIARDLLAQRGEAPLVTVSAMSNDPDCVESHAIRTTIARGGLDAHTVILERLDEMIPALVTLDAHQEEPFDQGMTMIQAVYLTARTVGIVSLLDGVAGDVVLSEGAVIERLLRDGHVWKAMTTSRDFERYWRLSGYGRKLVLSATSRMVVPGRLRSSASGALRHRRATQRVEEAPIDVGFAREMRLAERLMALYAHSPSPTARLSPPAERAAAIAHPYLVVGRERFERAAASVGLEPRDPFMDRRVVETALSFPDQSLVRGGWPKSLLRRAMADKVPDAVRWRVGKEHLGWAASRRRIVSSYISDQHCGQRRLAPLEGILRPGDLQSLVAPTPHDASDEQLEEMDLVRCIGRWLSAYSTRPGGRP